MESFVLEQKVLFRADFLSVTSDYRVQCPRVGQGVKIEDILDFFLSLFFALAASLYSCHLVIPSVYF